jgi:hypothetical protein
VHTGELALSISHRDKEARVGDGVFRKYEPTVKIILKLSYFHRQFECQYKLLVKMIFTIDLYYEPSIKIITSSFYKTAGESAIGENHFCSSKFICRAR